MARVRFSLPQFEFEDALFHKIKHGDKTATTRLKSKHGVLVGVNAWAVNTKTNERLKVKIVSAERKPIHQLGHWEAISCGVDAIIENGCLRYVNYMKNDASNHFMNPVLSLLSLLEKLYQREVDIKSDITVYGFRLCP